MTFRTARAALQITIWRPGLFGYPPDRYANIYRVVLPVLDVALLYSGIAAIRFGSPAFADFTQGPAWAVVWGVGMVTASLLCLIGITFPKALVLEAIGKSLVATGLAIYLLVLVVLTGQGSDRRALVAGISVGAFLLALFRLADIRTEVKKRRRDRQRAAAQEETARSGSEE